MRSVLLLFGVLAGAINTLMVARYGFGTSDTAVDGAIAAFYFGIIALGAIGGPAVAVHFLARRRWVWGGAFALLAAIALCANVVNSLGALAGRSDKTLAERAKAHSVLKEGQAQLKRIAAERSAMAFTPATEESVQAARDAVASAERNRVAECGPNNEKRGARCREREADAQLKQDALSIALANKALTDKATRLDGDAAALRERLANAPAVQSVDPLADTIGKLTDLPAEIAAAWQKASVVIVVELLIAFALVGFELLGVDQGARKPAQPNEPVGEKNVVALLPRPKYSDVVGKFMLERLVQADGEETPLTSIYADLQRWCGEQKPPTSGPDAATFGKAFSVLCERAGVRTARRGKAIYCLDLKIKALSAAGAA